MSLWGWIVVAYVAAVSIPLVVVDIREHRLPNRLVVPGVALSAVCALGELVTSGGQSWVPLASAAAYFVIMLALSVAGGLGMGDVKLAAILGAGTGFVALSAVLTQVFVAFFAGGLSALGLWMFKRRGNIPFGPFMLLGFWAAMTLALA
jgi:leader peptidase (prepilin peptidase)/N-methyltransferase